MLGLGMGRGGGSSFQLVASPGPQSHHAEMTCRDDWANLPSQHPSMAGSITHTLRLLWLRPLAARWLRKRARGLGWVTGNHLMMPWALNTNPAPAGSHSDISHPEESAVASTADLTPIQEPGVWFFSSYLSILFIIFLSSIHYLPEFL